jgi:hypothetical protein
MALCLPVVGRRSANCADGVVGKPVSTDADVVFNRTEQRGARAAVKLSEKEPKQFAGKYAR